VLRLKTVTWIGTLNIDRKISTLKEMPCWDQECIVDEMESHAAGTAVNAAFPLARLGAGSIRSNIIGCVGDDEDGRRIIRDVSEAGIHTGGIETVSDRTGISTLLISDTGEYSCITYLGSSGKLNLRMVRNHADLIRGADIVFLTGYFLSPELGYEAHLQLMAQAKADGKTVCFETGKDTAGWKAETVREVRDLLRFADYFIPSLSEARALSGKDTPEACAEDLRNCGAGTVIITLNDKGCIAASADGILRAPAFKPAQIADTLGAGDCFDAGLAYGLTQGWGLADILVFCNALCSLFISRKTNRYPTADEVMEVIHGS
jgi:ribokinase